MKLTVVATFLAALNEGDISYFKNGYTADQSACAFTVMEIIKKTKTPSNFYVKTKEGDIAFYDISNPTFEILCTEEHYIERMNGTKRHFPHKSLGYKFMK